MLLYKMGPAKPAKGVRKEGQALWKRLVTSIVIARVERTCLLGPCALRPRGSARILHLTPPNSRCALSRVNLSHCLEHLVARSPPCQLSSDKLTPRMQTWNMETLETNTSSAPRLFRPGLRLEDGRDLLGQTQPGPQGGGCRERLWSGLGPGSKLPITVRRLQWLSASYIPSLTSPELPRQRTTQYLLLKHGPYLKVTCHPSKGGKVAAN